LYFKTLYGQSKRTTVRTTQLYENSNPTVALRKSFALSHCSQLLDFGNDAVRALCVTYKYLLCLFYSQLPAWTWKVCFPGGQKWQNFIFPTRN